MFPGSESEFAQTLTLFLKGHEQFRTVTASHFRGAEALMVVCFAHYKKIRHSPSCFRISNELISGCKVFDVTKSETFDRVNSWLEEADMYIKKGYSGLFYCLDIFSHKFLEIGDF
jgi:hypothetical protein